MKKLHSSLVAALLALGISAVATGCTTIAPGYGIGSSAVISDATMEKTGAASATFLFGVIPLGEADCSLATAASNGGITKVATVDTMTHYSVLGIVVTRTTLVTGE